MSSSTIAFDVKQVEQSKISQVDFNNIEFGKTYSDHMFVAEFEEGEWKNFRIEPYADLSISPANATLHYAQSVFEGLKAYKTESGDIHVFRPDANAKRMEQVIKLLAPTNMSVIIQGESGTGKEMVANAIHQKSKRSKKPFVAIDCGALPKELAASELFGHIKGSFTGAINNKTGHFQMAEGGTLFLDEIGNLSYDNQIKLLRVLQERKIRKIGDTKDIPIDVRLIAASNEDLEDLAKNGEFREDLFYRLNEFMVDIAPLRERRDDILIFAKHFLNQANEDLDKAIEGFSDATEQILINHKWDGNLRELKNVIKRAVLLSPGNVLEKEALPVELSQPKFQTSTESDEITDLKSVAERAERKAIIKVLEQTGYNKTKTAKILKIDRKTLYNKLESYNIEFKRSYQ